MPRPKTASDAAILEAAFRVIGRIGPNRLTLADVAKEVNLSPATLVQRFGTKRGLLLALAKSGTEGVEECFAAIRAAHPSPLAALIAAATHMTQHVKSPEELANGLAFLQMDLSDPEFHALALDNSKRLEAGYRALVKDAIRAGELVPCNAARLVRALGAVSAGSLIAWAIQRQGTAEAWVRGDLEMLLAPYRVGSEKRTRRAR